MLTVFFAIVGLVAIGVVATRRNRAAVRARLRVSWGHPIERERQMGAIAASHRARLAYAGSGESLDTRTWDDLNLDAVFAAIDRTESTLGQHALYHRLRTAPIARPPRGVRTAGQQIRDRMLARENAPSRSSRVCEIRMDTISGGSGDRMPSRRSHGTCCFQC